MKHDLAEQKFRFNNFQNTPEISANLRVTYGNMSLITQNSIVKFSQTCGNFFGNLP